MRTARLEDYLYNIYKAETKIRTRRTVCLLGQTGIGKSESCRRVAQRLADDMNKEFVDYDDDNSANMILNDPSRYFVFIDFRLSEVEPSDLLGIPQKDNGAVRYAPLLWAKCLSRCAGILMLDEITNIQRPDVMTAAYKLVYDRRAGFLKFNDDVAIIAAGNRPEESAVANMLPSPLVNRMLLIDVNQPKLEEWQEYMNKNYGDDWDKRTFAFLKRFSNEGYFLKPPQRTETLEGFPTPRAWTHLSLLMHKGVNDRDTLSGLLGNEVGEKLNIFLMTNVDIEELIERPEKFHGLNLDGKYMGTVMLASWISNSEDLSRTFDLIDAMSSESREYLVTVCICLKREKLVKFLTQLFQYNPRYREFLGQVALEARAQIKK
ncbi:MAG: hypothetical protein ACOC5L_04955 [Halobacteriota archaeon]